MYSICIEITRVSWQYAIGKELVGIPDSNH